MIDEDDRKIWQGKCLSTPEAIGKLIQEHAPDAAKIGLETGNLSTYLWHGLNDMSLPVICIDAYHAHGVLKLRMNKTDKNDAHGLAQIMRSGWFKAVKVKSFASHEIRALYRARSSLVSMRSDVVNQIRGCLRISVYSSKALLALGLKSVFRKS